ncbi:uncharacterized protein PG998_014869 [Apiospora kogelbergensis]|uniref:uncharacterized protein n=1 Tax=Apiospora kogelbergensis TaxID=1337665 RepID=UPI003132422F
MSSPNAFPDRHHIHAVFAHFLEPKQGVLKFLEHVDDAVDFEVTGHSRFAGRWRSKQSYYDATWAHVDALLAAPGYRLQVPGGAGGIVVDPETGWSAVQMRTVDVATKSGVPYDQHYSWHIVEVKAFMDSDQLEKVLGGEMRRLGISPE